MWSVFGIKALCSGLVLGWILSLTSICKRTFPSWSKTTAEELGVPALYRIGQIKSP